MHLYVKYAIRKMRISLVLKKVAKKKLTYIALKRPIRLCLRKAKMNQNAGTIK